ncbi:MAG: glycosyltransferase [Prosthecobacter sp.]|uniref:glycosyltransferase n=1 Tax=Prosthecobacter sp. TaxID=1965333 RepID=UPI0019FCE570|nr:glycosyltransferase [Prosthecobacter sp.]MBE2286873.1 glycosyltransferase [Prosthecobacter sp.]
MKRIACVIDTISRNAGGLAGSLQGLMSAMQRQGDELCIFSVADAYSSEDQKQWAEFELYLAKAKGPRKFAYAPTLDRALEDYSADILHSHGLWTYTSLVSMNWQRKTRRPVIIHPHGMLDAWALKNSRWRKRLAMLLYERRNLKQAACIRALCQPELESIRALGLRNPVCVIPNGVNLPVLPGPTAVSRGSERKLLLYLGRLHPKKGIDLLVRAFGQLRQNGCLSDWTLVIAGWDQGGHEDELKSLAIASRLDWKDAREHPDTMEALEQNCLDALPSVVFAGPCFEAAKNRLYQQCDAFVLPSFSEGLPMVVLEAWSHAKPVVMTPMCNLPEGFSAGAAIRIESSVPSVAEGLRSLSALSASARQEMGASGRRLAETRFAWDQVARRMREVNFWLVRKGPRPDSVFTLEDATA